VEACQEGLADGTIDALASDHAPHSVSDKEVEYDDAEFGMVGLETAFPLYHRLHLTKGFSLHRILEAMTVKPAEIIGIPKGRLQPGADADLTIFDPAATWKIDKHQFRSKSMNTPFHGWEVQGRICYTIVGGRVAYEFDQAKKGKK
jgi:dihydroorotase